jgi:hypothetical protein
MSFAFGGFAAKNERNEVLAEAEFLANLHRSSDAGVLSDGSSDQLCYTIPLEHWRYVTLQHPSLLWKISKRSI